MNIIKRIKGILFEPSKFFDYLSKKEKTIGTSFIYLMVLSLFFTIIGFIIGTLLQGFWISLYSGFLGFEIPYAATPIIISLIFTIIGYGIGLLLSFVGAGILHLWFLIFGGKADYTKTYQLMVYSRTPTYVLGWIPFVNFFIWIWSLVLLILGTSKIHQMSKLKAALIIIIPIIVLMAIGITIFIFAISALLLTSIGQAGFVA